jgi:hypothetical protein
MAAVSLLAAVVAPSGLRMMAMARSTLCKTHLRGIGEGFAALQAEDELNAAGAQFAAATWRNSLFPYVGMNTKVYICPEDDNATFCLPESSIRIYGYGGGLLYEVQLFDAHPYWLENDHNVFLPDKPGMWCVNEEVYNDPNFDRTNMPRYTPGTDPSVTVWLIEDNRYGENHAWASGDADFNDLEITLVDLGGGVYEAEAVSDADYTFGIVGSDGVEHHQIGDMIPPMRLVGEGGSYGVNWRASDFQHGVRRALAMDYTETVIYAGGQVGEMENWDGNVAARHLGKVNLGMSDGTVASYDVEDIDPSDPLVDALMWDPAGGSRRRSGN